MLNSGAGNIRTILFKKSASLSATLAITRRNISDVVFMNSNIYKKSEHKREQTANIVIAFGKVSGLDLAGAEIAEIPGSFHSGGNWDKFSRVTALIRDANNIQLYFYRITDGTFWDRVHIPEDQTGADWPAGAIYVAITKADFDSRKKPPGY